MSTSIFDSAPNWACGPGEIDSDLRLQYGGLNYATCNLLVFGIVPVQAIFLLASPFLLGAPKREDGSSISSGITFARVQAWLSKGGDNPFAARFPWVASIVVSFVAAILAPIMLFVGPADVPETLRRLQNGQIVWVGVSFLTSILLASAFLSTRCGTRVRALRSARTTPLPPTLPDNFLYWLSLYSIISLTGASLAGADWREAAVRWGYLSASAPAVATLFCMLNAFLGLPAFAMLVTSFALGGFGRQTAVTIFWDCVAVLQWSGGVFLSCCCCCCGGGSRRKGGASASSASEGQGEGGGEGAKGGGLFFDVAAKYGGGSTGSGGGNGKSSGGSKGDGGERLSLLSPSSSSSTSAVISGYGLISTSASSSSSSSSSSSALIKDDAISVAVAAAAASKLIPLNANDVEDDDDDDDYDDDEHDATTAAAAAKASSPRRVTSFAHLHKKPPIASAEDFVYEQYGDWARAHARHKPAKKMSPSDIASFPSRVLFSWVSPMMILGYSRPLVAKDLPALPLEDAAASVGARFSNAWETAGVAARKYFAILGGLAPKRNCCTSLALLAIFPCCPAYRAPPKPPTGRPSIVTVLVSAYGRNFYSAAVFKLIYDLLQYVGPLILAWIINFLQDTASPPAGSAAPPVWQGYAFVGILFCTSMLQTALLHQYFALTMRVGQQLRSAITLAVYDKAVKLSLAARGAQSVGTMVNLMSTDAKRLQDLTTYLMMVISGPWQILLAIALLWQQIGVSVFAGVAVMVAFIPLNGYVATTSKKLQAALMKVKDKRVGLSGEALTGMRLIKSSAWDEQFLKRIGDLRDEELVKLRSYMLLQQVSSILWMGLPLMVCLVSLVTYTLINGAPPTAANLFSAIALFTLLRFPMALMPSVINSLVEASVTVGRIQAFLDAEEISPNAVIRIASIATADAATAAAAAAASARRKLAAGADADEEEGGVLPAWSNATNETYQSSFDVGLAGGGGGGGKSLLADDLSLSISGGNFAWGDVSAVSSTDIKAPPSTAAVATATPTPTRASSSRSLSSKAIRPLPRATLHDIELTIQTGSLVAIVGPVGGGKSSLLHAMLGEMRKLSGSVIQRGSVGFAAQSPFILNATLRDNVLYGLSYERERYESVLAACELLHDIELLGAARDMTEIGEKGVNLSGGQQARVALARLAYARPDVCIMDDVFAAVDAHVGSAIFQNVVCGLLKDRTRILVTHGMQYVPAADQVLFLAEGKIVERGTYADLVQKAANASGSNSSSSSSGNNGSAPSTVDPAHSYLASLLTSHQADSKAMAMSSSKGTSAATAASVAAAASLAASAVGTGLISTSAPPVASSKPTVTALTKASANPTATSSTSSSSSSATKAGTQITAEKLERGRVIYSVYAAYAKALGGWWMVIFLIASFVIYAASNVGSTAYLSYWETQTTGADRNSNLIFLGIYTGVSVSSLVVLVVQRIAVALTGIRASRVLHRDMLAAIFKAPISFMDTTPLGRVLNRVSQDIYTVDESLPNTFSSLLSTSLSVISSVILIGVVTPYFLVAAVPLGLLYAYIQRYYVSTSRELQRLDSLSKSPIFSNFSETLAGIVTVRAFGRASSLNKRNGELLDANQRTYFANISSNRWLAVRLETIGTLIVTASALFAVSSSARTEASFAALAGLSISTALSITQTLNWLVRMMSDVETQIVSVERIQEYTKLEPEVDWVGSSHGATGSSSSSSKQGGSSSKMITPPLSWPTKGELSIENLCVAHREKLPFVLNGVTVRGGIQGGERIGIAGRTGSGKSTLISALFRLADVQTGTIMIDGVDISRVPLKILRSRMSLIAQTPVLFSGDLRKNVDVLGEYTDEQVWQALRLVGLDERVKKLPLGLLAPVADGGSNFSQGERQLFTVARALLRRSKIVVCDEMSASIDVSSDAALQRAVKTEFEGSTVLTIAHRVNTIISDSNRILVLENGRVAEFDSPQALLNKGSRDSIFASMVQESVSATGGGAPASSDVSAAEKGRV